MPERSIAAAVVVLMTAACVVSGFSRTTVAAQAPATDSQAKRVGDRIRALQREADQLAGQSRTLLGDLRKLEIERDLRIAEAMEAAAAANATRGSLQATTDRIGALERQRDAQLPDLRTQLVDLYKRGHTGYAQLLFDATSIRDLARATRAVAALSSLNEKRLAEHRATLAELQAQRSALDTKARDLEVRQAEASRAQMAAERAVAARAALIARIDSERDLTAQYVGELQDAYDRLQLTSARGDRVALPLAPFRGGLDWPAAGRVTGRFGQSNRPGGAAVSNGIEIAAADGAPVRAVHGGTVAYADNFTGFGTLVIVDHGTNDFTLYGYLASTSVSRGDLVEAGSELGRVGTGPGTTPALYFEMRIDGRSVDPVQWLKPR